MTIEKMVFLKNSAASFKTFGETADWVGDVNNPLGSLITAKRCGLKAITFQSQATNADGSRIICTSEIGLVRKYTPKSPDFCGIVELANQGKFKVVAWVKYLSNGDSYVFSLFEPYVERMVEMDPPLPVFVTVPA